MLSQQGVVIIEHPTYIRDEELVRVLRIGQCQATEHTVEHVGFQQRMRIVEPIPQMHPVVGSSILVHKPRRIR